MADSTGKADIRGIDIDKLAKGFADEEIMFKRICQVTKTKAREIRWYQKTPYYLSGTKTTGMTTEFMSNAAAGALPTVVEQSWTRQTSYVRKYFVESPTISMEDIKDSDVDILATNVRDLVRGVARKVDKRIYDVMTAGVGNTNATSSGTWDQSGSLIVNDIATAKMDIRLNGYNPEGAYMLMTPLTHKNLLTWLIDWKGAAIPAFSSERVRDGVVMGLLGLNVLVSTNVDADEVMVVIPKRAMTWKAFMPITSVVIDDPGIGKKIRVWEEGEAIMTDVNAAAKITNVDP